MIDSPLARVAKLRGAPNPISPREIEVIQHIVLGLTNREIAKRLHVSIGTICKHRTAIREKLKLRNGADIARWVASQAPHCASCTCGGEG